MSIVITLPETLVQYLITISIMADVDVNASIEELIHLGLDTLQTP